MTINHLSSMMQRTTRGGMTMNTKKFITTMTKAMMKKRKACTQAMH